MKFALSIIALILVALVVPFLIPGLAKQDGLNPETDLPWQIEVDGQGTTLRAESELVVRGARVVVRDLRHPGRTGSGFLFTLEATVSVQLAELHLANAPADDRDGAGHYQGGTIEIMGRGPDLRDAAVPVTVALARGSAGILCAAVPPRGRFAAMVFGAGRWRRGSGSRG